MADQAIKVKKVKAYPISVQMNSSGGVITGQIMKLTHQGFLAEITANFLQPGDKLDVNFELPLVHHTVHEPCLVMKLYNQWGGSGAAPAAPSGGEQSAPAPAQASMAPTGSAGGPHVLRLVEIHFQSLAHPNKERISTFLHAVAKAPHT